MLSVIGHFAEPILDVYSSGGCPSTPSTVGAFVDSMWTYLLLPLTRSTVGRSLLLHHELVCCPAVQMDPLRLLGRVASTVAEELPVGGI